MHLKLLALAAVILTVMGLISFGAYLFICNGFAEFYNGYHLASVPDAMQDVQIVRIQDDGEGFSSIFPVTVHAVMIFQKGMWRGSVVLFIDRHMSFYGKDLLDTQQKTVSVAVPNEVMQKFSAFCLEELKNRPC